MAAPVEGTTSRFLIDLGLANKGRDREAVKSNHVVYNIDGDHSGCYYCRVVREGQHWRQPSHPSIKNLKS
jgi:hypothetical protein